jgi:charged multivesicular body protein 1
MEKGNMEGASIYAQNAIRKKNEAMNSLRLASRMDGVASRVETAVRMKSITRTMGGVVSSLNVALQGMDVMRVRLLLNPNAPCLMRLLRVKFIVC